MNPQKIKDGDLCVVDFDEVLTITAAVFTFDEKNHLTDNVLGQIKKGELVIVINAEAKSSRDWSVVITRLGVGLIINRKIKVADDKRR